MLRFIGRVVVIGCGGTGSWLLPPLARFLDAEEFPGEIHLWDGDRYSPENRVRQEFAAGAIGANKAEVQAGALRMNYPALRVFGHPNYVGEGNVDEALRERDLAFVCVDNHPARVLVDGRAGELRDACVLSAGNEKLDGNVCVALRRNGKPVTLSLLARHPEVAKVRRGDRGAMGCEALVLRGETQLLVTNFMAAAAALATFHMLWTHGERSGHRRLTALPQETYFDASQGAMSVLPVAAADS